MHCMAPPRARRRRRRPSDAPRRQSVPRAGLELGMAAQKSLGRVLSSVQRHLQPPVVAAGRSGDEKPYEVILRQHYASMPHVKAVVEKNSAPLSPAADPAGGGDTGLTIGFNPFAPGVAGSPDGSPPPLTANRLLASHHRVVLGSWPISGAIVAKDPRVSSLHALFSHVRGAGYDGAELGVQFCRYFFPPTATDTEVLKGIREAALSAGICIPGVLVSIADSGMVPTSLDRPSSVDPAQRVLLLDWSDPQLDQKLEAALILDKAIGCEYATLQFNLPPHYENTGGQYRDDAAFIALCAARVQRIQRLCFALGLNFYLETHIGVSDTFRCGHPSAIQAALLV